MSNAGTRAVRVDRSDLRAATSALDPVARTETALPSYTHPNPLIRWLFWQRLDTAVRFAAVPAGASVLDFGTGLGILLPSLARAAGRIVATDVNLSASRSLAHGRGIAVEFVERPHFAGWAATNDGTLDRIFALDVLEHVGDDELVALSGVFASLLRSRGALIVSGPTESKAYKLGRALAGFMNEYHHRTVFDIDRVLAARWHVAERTFVPHAPLPRAFEITRYTRSG